MPDPFSLHNKIAIVTGASKGIGRAIALAIGQQGATVIVSSRKQEAVEETANEFRHMGINAHGVACHMGDPEQVKKLLSYAVTELGGVDIIINNAATNPVFGPILNTDLQVLDKIMAVNVKGSIANIAGVGGITPEFGLGLYSISKAALIAATKVLAKEWGSDQIRVNVICPGLVKTKFSEALTSSEKIMKIVMAKQALPMVAEPEDIAGLAVYLSSDASRFNTGAVITLDGGFTI
jgi:dehydrogenase/reductase SDR family member 4